MVKNKLQINDLKDMLNKTREMYAERPAYKIRIEEGKYKISILDTQTSGTIKVTTNSDDAKVDIANTQEYATKAKEYELIIKSLGYNNKQISELCKIPLDVTEDVFGFKTNIIMMKRIV